MPGLYKARWGSAVPFVTRELKLGRICFWRAVLFAMVNGCDGLLEQIRHPGPALAESF